MRELTETIAQIPRHGKWGEKGPGALGWAPASITLRRMAYSKLHASLVSSSLWTEADATRLLYITMLAMADRQGYVYGSRQGIARIANIDPDEIDEAWYRLLGPDPGSGDLRRNPDADGRRVEEVPEGFLLVNYGYYRGLRDDDDRREQNRQAQARFRAKKREAE